MNKNLNTNLVENSFAWGEYLDKAQNYKYGWILLLTPALCGIACHLIDTGFQKFGEIIAEGHPVEVDLKNGVIKINPHPVS